MLELISRSIRSVRKSTNAVGYQRLFHNMFMQSSSDVGQPSPYSHPELLKQGEILPGMSASEFSERRNSVMEKLPGNSALLVGSASIKRMAGVIPYPYRQDADYLYLTGCTQPGGVALLEKAGLSKEAKFTMFMPQHSRDTEVWDGHVADTEAAVTFFKANEAYPIQKLEAKLTSLLSSDTEVFYDSESSIALHGRFRPMAEAARVGRLRSPKRWLHDERWKKSDSEKRLMRHSASIACQAMLAAMKCSVAEPHESRVAAAMEFECKNRGAQRMAFPSVVGSGENGCTIHYSRNDKKIRDGELVLVDAGCEYFGYCSDVTRVWAPHGQFSKAQKEVYNEVLGVHAECLEMCIPGNSLRSIHLHAVQALSRSMARLGLLDSAAEEIAKGAYKYFFPTAVGHWLGMDTHDCAFVGLNKPLEEGVILTIEPGLYIPRSSQVPKRYQGIGIRIEDDVLITSDGSEVLTGSVPKEVSHVEAWIRQCKSQQSMY